MDSGPGPSFFSFSVRNKVTASNLKATNKHRPEMEFFGSIARRGFVSDCGRKSRNHPTQVVEGKARQGKDFHIIMLI